MSASFRLKLSLMLDTPTIYTPMFQVLENCHKISTFIDGVKAGYPGLDLICFPEYSTQVLLRTCCVLLLV